MENLAVGFSSIHPHPREVERAKRIWQWKWFRKDILRRGRSLDILIEFVEKQRNFLINNELEPFSIKGEYHFYPIWHPKIIEEELPEQLLEYLGQEYRKTGITDMNEGNRFIYNLTFNLSRGLKYYKESLHFLLPSEDIKYTKKFIDYLKSPSIKFGPFGSGRFS